MACGMACVISCAMACAIVVGIGGCRVTSAMEGAIETCAVACGGRLSARDFAAAATTLGSVVGLDVYCVFLALLA